MIRIITNPSSAPLLHRSLSAVGYGGEILIYQGENGQELGPQEIFYKAWMAEHMRTGEACADKPKAILWISGLLAIRSIHDFVDLIMERGIAAGINPDGSLDLRLIGGTWRSPFIRLMYAWRSGAPLECLMELADIKPVDMGEWISPYSALRGRTPPPGTFVDVAA